MPLDQRDHDALSGRGMKHRDVATAPGRVGCQRGCNSCSGTVAVCVRAETVMRIRRTEA